MLSATASLGLVLLWDVDGGLTPIDKYLYSAEDYIKVCTKYKELNYFEDIMNFFTALDFCSFLSCCFLF